jgi:hypothetical protein
MDDEDLKIFIEDFCDFLNGLESNIVKMRMQIEKLIGPAAGDKRAWKWNPDAIKWEKTEGWKGDYERSEDVNSLDFKELLKDLEGHQGKLSRDRFFYWRFEKSAVVGRKKRQ